MSATKKAKNEEIEVTLEELSIFRANADRYRQFHPEEKSLLTFGLQKLASKYEKTQQSIIERMNEKIQEQSVRLASVKEGNLIENRFDLKVRGSEETDTRYSYTPEKKIELQKAIIKIRDEFQKEKVKIVPFYVAIPEDLDYSYYNVFKKFVFEELSEEDEIKFFVEQKKDKKENQNGQKPMIESVLQTD